MEAVVTTVIGIAAEIIAPPIASLVRESLLDYATESD